MNRIRVRLFSWSLLLVSAASTCFGQTPSERTVVVYNSAHAHSIDVANYYITQRGIPAQNLCAIHSPSLAAVTQAQFEVDVQAPVQQCVASVGKAHVLYIVLAYPVPYKLTAANGRVYSVDQALADLWNEDAPSFASPYPARAHGYYVDSQSQGRAYPAFVSFAAYRAQAGTPAIYSVWRLDGSDSSIAKGLVDKALQAELNGLQGAACLDRRFGDINAQRDTGDGAVEWELARAAEYAGQAGFSVIEDATSPEFGTAPAPLRCDNAALYTGWYSLNKYWDVFTWNPGAIGFHLDGSSALDPRGGTNWSANALQRGITITSGALASPTYYGFVHADGIFRNLFEGANVGDAVLRNSPWLKWVVINIGDPLYRPFPTGRAPFNGSRLENALTLTPQSLIGGGSVTGTVSLDAPAPTGGAPVMLSTGSTSVATVPATVSVPAGATTATFNIATRSTTSAEVSTVIRAAYGGVTRANTVVIMHPLKSLALESTSITGGVETVGTVLLSQPASSGGMTVVLSSSNAAATVPTSIFIAAGMDRATFQVTTTPVATKTPGSISATHSGRTSAVTLSVNSPAAESLILDPVAVTGGSPSTAIITLTGMAPSEGLAVTLASSNTAATVPATVIVPAGTKTSTFSIMTTVVAANTSSSISATAGGIKKSATLTIRVPSSSFTIAVSPTTRVGGSSATLTATLASPAPEGGTVVALSSNNAAASVPASMTVPAGSQTASAPVATTPVDVNTPVSLTASASGFIRTAGLTVTAPTITSMRLTSTSIVGGTSTSARVYLSGAAPSAGMNVTLSTSNSSAVVPASVAVAPGSTSSASFPVSTTAVSTQTTILINGTIGTVTKSATLTLRPPNQLPTAALTSPTEGASYLAPATVSLSASAMDSDGTISKVDYLNGSTVLCTATITPYTCSWTAPAGTHSIAARATDNNGGVATSAVVPIHVKGVRIMPLGDSITHGADIPGGYRIGLWSMLTNQGSNVDYVGSEVNGPTTLVDTNHQGHRGWRIDQIQAIIDARLTTYQPQVILLHIGTNDMNQNYSVGAAPNRLSALIDQITTAMPQVYVVVASILPMQDAAKNSRVVQFNSAIPGIVDAKRAAGKRVSHVDMYNALTLADLYDGIHPNTGGYDKMAAVWLQALTPIMPLLTPQ